MRNLNTLKDEYLLFCQNQKCLDEKTLKAYKIDLIQFLKMINTDLLAEINTNLLENYICALHQTYKPKTAKRKIASVKAFFHYLEYKDYVSSNPFSKIHIKFREPVILPKTIPLNTVELFLSTMYNQLSFSKNDYQYKNTLRDIAVIELLFATGIRISELCSLSPVNVNLINRTVLIYGKGSKERIIQIGNEDVHKILCEYVQEYQHEIERTISLIAKLKSSAKMNVCLHKIERQNNCYVDNEISVKNGLPIDDYLTYEFDISPINMEAIYYLLITQ